MESFYSNLVYFTITYHNLYNMGYLHLIFPDNARRESDTC